MSWRRSSEHTTQSTQDYTQPLSGLGKLRSSGCLSNSQLIIMHSIFRNNMILPRKMT